MARHRFPLIFPHPLFWLPALLLASLLLLTLPGMAQAAPAGDTVQASISDGGAWYVVQRGDNLFRISLRFGTSVNAIARANHLIDSNRIVAGQRLWIPSGYAPPPTGGSWYVVRPGDNLFRIALHHGLTAQALAAANHIADPNRIKVGQRLWIPGGHMPPPPAPPPYPGPHPDPHPHPSPHPWPGGDPPPDVEPPPGDPKPDPKIGYWTGTFFNTKNFSGGPIRTENTTKIDYDWGAGGPDGLNADNFSAIWTGTFDFPAGVYRFLVTADDGVRLFLDETPIIDGWRDQSATGFFKDANVSAGEHIVRVEYYEGEGNASISVSWRKLQ